MPRYSSKPCPVGRYSGRWPRCHLPRQRLAYPTRPSAVAKVVSFRGSPPTADGPRTPPVHAEPARPERIGRRPVSMAARDGVHTWKAEYHCVKRTPLAASRSMLGVTVVGCP